MSKLNRPLRLGKWRPSIPCLEAHMEAGSLRVGDRIYVIGGYQTLTRMCARMQILDIERGTWSYGPALPEGFPLTHAGLATDGRFLFFVSGQPGPACEPASNRAWAFDLEKMAWEPMGPLPAARYSPLAEYIDGNLHVISGAIEDRDTICNDHFIMPIRGPGTAATALPGLESQEWRKGPPIPAGGDHAASVVIDERIYVIGGEHGHAAMTMDPARCCGTYWVHTHLFRYDPKREEWTRLADMPFGSSHIESKTAPPPKVAPRCAPRHHRHMLLGARHVTAYNLPGRFYLVFFSARSRPSTISRRHSVERVGISGLARRSASSLAAMAGSS